MTPFSLRDVACFTLATFKIRWNDKAANKQQTTDMQSDSILDNEHLDNKGIFCSHLNHLTQATLGLVR